MFFFTMLGLGRISGSFALMNVGRKGPIRLFCYSINLIFSFWCLEHIDVGLVTKILCVLELIEILGCADFSHVQGHNCTPFFCILAVKLYNESI